MTKKFKKTLSLLMAAAVLPGMVGLMAHTAYAISDGSLTAESSISTLAAGVSVSSASALVSAVQAGGSVSLSGDVQLSDTLSVSSGTVTLDLNGHTLTAAAGKGAVRIDPGAALTLEDTGINGKITGGNTEFGGAVYNSGTLTITGGTITGNTGTEVGGGIYSTSGSTLKIMGGTISGNTSAVGSAIYAGGSFTLGGAPAISGDIELGRDQVITLSRLTGSGYSIAMDIPGVFTKGASAADRTRFVSADSACMVSVNGDGELLLAEAFANGEELQEAVRKGGSIALQGNVTMDSNLYIYNDAPAVILDLNGYTLSASGGSSVSVIMVEKNAELYLMDSSEKQTGTINTGKGTNGVGAGIANHGTLSVKGCTISNGSTLYGGGIMNRGELIVDGTVFKGCKANYGGGIYNEKNVTIKGMTMEGCTAENYGGGIYNSGTLTFENGTISGCKASDGGGVFNSGSLTLKNGTIEKNTASGGKESAGGGIFNNSKLTMTGGNICDNTAIYGGGIYNANELTVQGGLLTGNTASGNPSGSGIETEKTMTLAGSPIIGDVIFLNENSPIEISGLKGTGYSIGMTAPGVFTRGAASVSEAASRFSSAVAGYGVKVVSSTKELELSRSGQDAGKTNISGAKITLSQISYTADGTAKKPGVTVKLDGKTLKEGTDYTVTYVDNVNPGIAKVLVTGKGNYSGQAVAIFIIWGTGSGSDNPAPGPVNPTPTPGPVNPTPTPGPTVTPTPGSQDPSQTGNLADAKVKLSKTKYNYNGKAKKPVVSVILDGKVLRKGVDYKVSYSSNVEIGTAKVTIKGIGQYSGKVVKKFYIYGKLTSSKVKLSSTKLSYTGNKRKPGVTVTFNGKKLVKNTDYTISYKNNLEVGTAVVTVTGKGNYKGTVEKEFKIYENKSYNKKQLDKGLKAVANGSGFKLTWGKVTTADGYDVFFDVCEGQALSSIKAITTTGTSKKITKINGKKLNLKQSFKLQVKAYRMVNGKKKYIASSMGLHFSGKNAAKSTNAKKVKTTKSAYSLKVGKTATIKGSITLENSKKKLVNHVSPLRYWSSKVTVASVDAKGKITAKKKGSCYVYVVAPNGVKTKVKVTVK